MQKLESLGYP